MFPKNLERGKGPSASCSSPLECLDFELCLLSFLFLDLDLDLDLLFDSLESSSSSLLEDSDDELEEELDPQDFLKCYYFYYRKQNKKVSYFSSFKDIYK